MNQFIYLDNDIVSSIIAQKDNGLVKDIKTENTDMSNSKKHNSLGTDIEGRAEGGLLKVASLEAQVKIDARFENEKDVSKTTREIIEKTMHDAAFNIVYEHIKAKKVQDGGPNNIECGSYVEIKRIFDFVDLNYLEGLFSEDGLIEYIKKSTSEEIKKNMKEQKGDLNRQQRRNNGNQLDSLIKKAIEENNKNYDNMCEMIKMLKKMIPYSRMLISNDGYLIPMDEKYFRVNPTSIGFMYGGEIICVGMVTNLIGKISNPNNDNNIFATLQFSVNEALRLILPTKEENICVIHPIAIYYNK